MALNRAIYKIYKKKTHLGSIFNKASRQCFCTRKLNSLVLKDFQWKQANWNHWRLGLQQNFYQQTNKIMHQHDSNKLKQMRVGTKTTQNVYMKTLLQDTCNMSGMNVSISKIWAASSIKTLSYYNKKIYLLIRFWQMFLFYTPWKHLVFWCLRGAQNGIIGQKGVHHIWLHVTLPNVTLMWLPSKQRIFFTMIPYMLYFWSNFFAQNMIV